MKIKIIYNLEDHDDQRQYEIANKAKDLAEVLVGLAEFIDNLPHEDSKYYPVRDKFRELLKENNVDINKL